LDIEEACIVTSTLRQVELFRLPKLKHVWNKDSNENISFENLREVHGQECWSLKTLFPFLTARDLQQLESLIVDSCGVEEIVSKSEGLDKHETLFEFNQLSFLVLWALPNLVCFYTGMHNITCPMLERLRTYWSTKIKKFGHVVSQLLLIGKQKRKGKRVLIGFESPLPETFFGVGIRPKRVRKTPPSSALWVRRINFFKGIENGFLAEFWATLGEGRENEGVPSEMFVKNEG
ncbi:hypothetical protein Goklo_021750, partial [Gossypium klotzschianum]|nr:hypothetical protein [Gossypium klotzschianum]